MKSLAKLLIVESLVLMAGCSINEPKVNDTSDYNIDTRAYARQEIKSWEQHHRGTKELIREHGEDFMVQQYLYYREHEQNYLGKK